MSRRAPDVVLLPRLRALLERFGRSSSLEAFLVERANILLLSSDGLLCIEVADQLGVDAQRVRRWRRRWSDASDRLVAAELQPVSERDLEALVVDVLSDNYRSGTPRVIQPEQIAKIISLACESPKDCGRPVTHWTPRELALEAVKRKIVDEISPRHIARFFGGERTEATPITVLAQSKNRRSNSARRRYPGRLRDLRTSRLAGEGGRARDEL